MDLCYKGKESIDLDGKVVFVLNSLNYCYHTNRPMVDLGYGVVSDLKLGIPDFTDDDARRHAQIGFGVYFNLDQFGPSIKTETGMIIPIMDVSRKVTGTRIEIEKYCLKSDNQYLVQAFDLAYDYLNAFIYNLSKIEGKMWNYDRIEKDLASILIFPTNPDDPERSIRCRKVA